MKTLIAVSALALAAAGCATEGNPKYAKAECKIAPITTLSAAGGKTGPVSSLDQRQAEMWLGTSEYRMRLLREQGRFGNNVEEALYNCDR